MQYCCRIVALFTLCIYLFVLIDASLLFVKNDNFIKPKKKEIKDANDNSEGISDDHQEPISRIINQDKKPEDIYPWLAGVLMDFTTLRKKEKKKKGCTGSLVSERYILTAAHCLCWFDDIIIEQIGSSTSKSLPSLRCLPNIEQVGNDGQVYLEYVDQIQDNGPNNYNKVYFVLGAKNLPQFDRFTGNFGTSSNHWSPAEKAIIMDTKTNGKEINLEKGYDVGLILLKEKDRPHRPQPIDILLNKSKYPVRKFKGKKGFIAGYGSRFVFGKHSDESPGTKDDPSKYSSCMTSEKGSLDSRFKYCDTSEIFDQGCNKNTHPEDDLEDRNNCKRDWLGAKDAINEVDLDGFDGLARKLRKSDRIRVYASKPNAGSTPPSNECVNVNWILKYGWCKIADDTQGIWGICSPSCEFLGEHFDKSEKLQGSRYYEIPVSITEQLVFKENLKKICDLEDSKLDNDAEMCLKAIPPKTDIVQFYRDKRKKLVFDKFVQEDPSRAYGYLGSAEGDSGCPVWVRIHTLDRSGARPMFTLIDRLIGIVTSLGGDESKMGNKPVETEGVIIGTKINEEILKWINLHTQLQNK